LTINGLQGDPPESSSDLLEPDFGTTSSEPA
jgi:hypothetical protein